MKKLYYSAAFFIIFSTSASAQSFTGEAKINKMLKTAIINELPFNEEVTEDAVKKKMSQLGYTAKKDDGYLVYKNVSLPELGVGSYNLYFKTERKSKKEKESSLVYMLISDSYDAFITPSRDSVINNGKAFLNTFSTPAQDVAIDNDIKEQEENMKKAEKRYDNSVDDGRSLEGKRRKIEKDIEENKRDQEQKRAEMERQRQVLETAKSKKRP